MEKTARDVKATKKFLEGLPMPDNLKALRLLRATNPRKYLIFILLTVLGMTGLICAASYVITLLTGWPFGLTVALLILLRYIFT